MALYSVHIHHNQSPNTHASHRFGRQRAHTAKTNNSDPQLFKKFLTYNTPGFDRPTKSVQNLLR